MFNLRIITLSGVFMDSEAFEIRVPTTGGDIAINGGHAPLVGAIRPGLLSITRKRGDRPEEIEQVGVYEGTVEVLHNIVNILVDDVDTPDEISESEAEKAFARAKELTEKAGDSVALAEAQSMMDRSAVRLQLAGLKKRSSKR
jgi:F-type H+-transporting ATPase subunit epsilon